MSEKNITNIAYSPNRLYILIPSFLSIFMNCIFIFHYVFKLLSNKKENKMTSLEKLLLPLSILESIISLFWFISGEIFQSDKEIQDNFTSCKIYGTVQIFCYIFDWVLTYLTITHLKNMILNPLNYILKSGKKIIKYLIISCGMGLVGAILSYIFNAVGESPMITCFLSIKSFYDQNTEVAAAIKIIKLIIIGLICFIPVFNLFSGFIQIIIVCKSDYYKLDNENKKMFNNHALYLFIYFIMTFCLFSLYILEFIIMAFKNSINELHLQAVYFIISLMICITPLIVGVIRLKQTKIISTLFKEIKNKCCSSSISNDKESILNPLIDNESTFEQFESSAIKKFVMNIYIAVCFCLEKKIPEDEIKYENLNEQMCNETIQYKISRSEIMKDLSNGRLINDRLVKLRGEFSISCVEFSPKFFKYLRQLDGIKEEIIVKSMLPMNNKIGITETEGKGGSFFVNSDDKEFILKTITFEEMELIRRLLLNKLVNYLHENNDSIISRIYGVYKISIKNGIFKEDEIYFVLMKNLIASFSDNLICKYDLKGSSLNRKVKFENIDKKVMKDINFNEAEQVLLLNKNNSQKLQDIVKKDAEFFNSCGIMDYSLLVAKISLNNEEIKFLFGKNHRKKTEKEYLEMVGVTRMPSINSLESSQNSVEIKVNDKDDKKDINNQRRFEDNRIECLRKYFYPSLKGDILYIIGIIDFFQLYNLHKSIETKYKIFANRVKANVISSMPPKEYKERFIEFVKNITNSENYLKEINDPENKNDF